MAGKDRDKNRRQDAPDPAPEADTTATKGKETPPATPTPDTTATSTTKPATESTAQEVVKDVEKGAIATALIGAAVAFLNSEHGPKVLVRGTGEVLGWTKEGLAELADDSGPVGDAADAFADWADRHSTDMDDATAREEEKRHGQTGLPGLFGRIFNPTPLVLTTNADGTPVPPPATPRPRWQFWHRNP